MRICPSNQLMMRSSTTAMTIRTPGGRQNQGHIGDPDGLGDDAAQTAAAHESCEYRSADGVYHRDADAGEHRGKARGNSTISTR